MKFSQSVASIVINHFVREKRPDVGDVSLLYQKFGKLEYSLRQFGRFVTNVRRSQQFGIEISNHGSTGTGGANHRLCRPEYFHETLCQRFCFLPVPSIECGLAATRLVFGKVHLISDTTQHACHVKADLWKKLVNKARNE